MKLGTSLAGALLALAACAPLGSVDPKPVPAAPPPDASHVPSPLSQETAAYYRLIQHNLLARGLMRTDGGGPDTPFSTRDVVENFMRIALYAEYADRNGQLVAEATASRLQRWERPVVMSVVAGASSSPEQQARDRALIGGFASRLQRVSRHPVTLGAGPGNFTVLILDEDERRGFGPRLRQLMPGLSPATLAAIIQMPASVYCLVVARDDNGSGAYVQAVAVIRAEHPDLMRLSCVHEELAQGLGLANDSPRARPSVFNDDEEFALLTRMDEILLRILYDPRLRPGMTEAEARPIVEVIAAELMGGAS